MSWFPHCSASKVGSCCNVSVRRHSWCVDQYGWRVFKNPVDWSPYDGDVLTCGELFAMSFSGWSRDFALCVQLEVMSELTLEAYFFPACILGHQGSLCVFVHLVLGPCNFDVTGEVCTLNCLFDTDLQTSGGYLGQDVLCRIQRFPLHPAIVYCAWDAGVSVTEIRLVCSCALWRRLALLSVHTGGLCRAGTFAAIVVSRKCQDDYASVGERHCQLPTRAFPFWSRLGLFVIWLVLQFTGTCCLTCDSQLKNLWSVMGTMGGGLSRTGQWMPFLPLFRPMILQICFCIIDDDQICIRCERGLDAWAVLLIFVHNT